MTQSTTFLLTNNMWFPQDGIINFQNLSLEMVSLISLLRASHFWLLLTSFCVFWKAKFMQLGPIIRYESNEMCENVPNK